MELTSDFDGYATAKPIGNEAKGRLSVVTDIHPFFTKIDLFKVGIRTLFAWGIFEPDRGGGSYD